MTMDFSNGLTQNYLKQFTSKYSDKAAARFGDEFEIG
jgi:hypothetical protein